MTALTPVTCITIVAESVLEARLTGDLEAAGARGWTVTTARGHGPRGRRASEIEGGNIRVEVLVSEEVAERIWQLLEEKYFPHYAIAAWSNNVGVVRAERYTAGC
jgi:hypothetical protein